MKIVERISLIIFVTALVSACATQKPTPVSLEDNPVHHYLQGMQAIDQGAPDEAAARFERALYLDKSYGPALAGKALAIAMQAESLTSKNAREAEMQEAFKVLKQAKKQADNDSFRFIYHVSAVRVFMHGHAEDWMVEAESHYEKALNLKKVREEDLPYYQDASAAHYFMGIAYYKAYAFRKAEDTLALTMASKPAKWHEAADALYKKVQKIVRACGHYTLTDVGNRIAVKDEVTRGDVAALLVDELHLDKLFAGRIPVKSQLPQTEFVPLDIKDHPLRGEIATVIKWRVRGLETRYDDTAHAQVFRPQDHVKRKEMAFILEDVIVKLTANEQLALMFIGVDKSPFPDVPVQNACFNAVMNVTTRCLMETELSGEFRPNQVINGANAILALMKLRNVMNIY
jgi:hypothetical protein